MNYSTWLIPILALAFVGGNLLEPPARSTTWDIENERDIASFFGGEPLELQVDTASTTSPTHKPVEAVPTLPFLAHYPFEALSPEIEIAEGFAAYDGYLGDTRGEYHKGIDYIRKQGNAFLPFNVYSMHNGEAWRGSSETWGNFVIIRRTMTPTLRYYTIYAHLDGVPQRLQELSKEKGVEIEGSPIKSGAYLGFANTSGNTRGVSQFHMEMHEQNLITGTWVKLDPYGIYSTKSSRRYPDPGDSLNELDHYWVSDRPKFVQ